MNPLLNKAVEDGLSVSEFVELQKQKGEFEKTAEGFKTNMPLRNHGLQKGERYLSQEEIKARQEPTAQELLNEGSLSPLSYSKIKRAISIKATRGEVERGEYRDLKTGRLLGGWGNE